MPQTFLKAEWRKLIMANYTVDPALLEPYLPAGTVLDSVDGNHYLSLVGFMFRNTRLAGRIAMPLHIHFEEVNLRFYVQHTGAGGRRRGVVFIRELVPRAALTFVANTFYGEAYRTVPMHHKWRDGPAGRVVSYRWKANGWQRLQVVADKQSIPITAGSHEEFITEHYWGYTKLRNNRTSEYEVVHPRWDIYPVQRYTIDVDFAGTYGPQFAFLNGASPYSVLLAEGSEVTVRSGAKIRLPQS